MRWHEITIYTREESTEAIAAFLQDLGTGGVSIEESGNLDRPRDTSLGQWYELPLNDIPEGDAEMKGYFAELAVPEELVEQVKSFLAKLPEFGLDPGKALVSIREVDEEDWANAWKQYYKPVRISDKLTIKPTWESYEPSVGELILELDPGMAFGTGTHPTTSLCLRVLENIVKPGDEVIDVGTGSGILSIAAAKLGAKGVLALDLDPVAVSSATENVRLNGMEELVQVRQSDLLQAVKTSEAGGALRVTTPVDVVVANILAEIILLFVGDVSEALKDDGIFIASGIIETKRQQVEDALAENGFDISERYQEQDWVALVAKKQKGYRGWEI